MTPTSYSMQFNNIYGHCICISDFLSMEQKKS